MIEKQIDEMEKLQDRLINRSCTENNLRTSLLLMEAAEAIGNLLAGRCDWISVDKRLPEVATTEKGWGDHKVKKSVRVLCVCKQKSGKVLVKEGYYELWDYSDKPYWKIPGSIDSVTHWMPLPLPPTEKED